MSAKRSARTSRGRVDGRRGAYSGEEFTIAERPAEAEDRAVPGHGVYGISVAAELSGIPVQSLRLYERYGLVTPARSQGGTRRYSADDLARLRRISGLVEAGVNLAGIARILDLKDDNETLSAANTDLRSTNRTLRQAAKATKSARAGTGTVTRP